MTEPKKPTLEEWMQFMYDPQQAIDLFKSVELDDLTSNNATMENDND